MRPLIFVALVTLLLVGCGQSDAPKQNAPTADAKQENPFMTEWDTPFGVPDFSKIKDEHYIPAVKKGIEQNEAAFEKIAANSEAPSFENTIEAIEEVGDLLSRPLNVFFNLLSAETTPALQSMAREISPMLSKHTDDISLNPELFARVKAVWDDRENLSLNREGERLLESTYKRFVRGGANLSEEQKERFREINKEISLLTLKFGENLLAENKAFKMVIDNTDDLAGLPEDVVTAAAQAAEANGQAGKYLFTLDKPSMIPFLQKAERRELREKIYKAYIMRGDNGNEQDNNSIVSKIAALRSQRATILGYKSHAHFVLEENMSKSPEGVYGLLDKLWQPALNRAKEERDEMNKMLDEPTFSSKIQGWDWWYYAEKLRAAKYDFDENELRPYFSLEATIQGAFVTANRLFGVTFEQRDDIPKYHPDVRTYEVKSADGKHIGIFLADYHPRPGKRGGAWMNAYRKQSRQGGKEITPIIVNVCNFSPPVGNKPALLSFTEVTTLFHEFGHALHGLLSDCTYDSLSGTATPRDFVEFPAQIYEHWAGNKEVLTLYAKHYETGEVIPDRLVEKMKNAAKFNQGFATTEYLAASLLDMAWHTIEDGKQRDTKQFEKETLETLGLIPEIASRYRSTYFAHIFAGGYSAGYYSYIWSEVLDADGFQAFKETSVFDRTTADRLLKYVYSAGATEEPAVLYRKFRGADPKIDALLENRGLN